MGLNKHTPLPPKALADKANTLDSVVTDSQADNGAPPLVKSAGIPPEDSPLDIATPNIPTVGLPSTTVPSSDAPLVGNATASAPRLNATDKVFIPNNVNDEAWVLIPDGIKIQAMTSSMPQKTKSLVISDRTIASVPASVGKKTSERATNHPRTGNVPGREGPILLPKWETATNGSNARPWQARIIQNVPAIQPPPGFSVPMATPQGPSLRGGGPGAMHHLPGSPPMDPPSNRPTVDRGTPTHATAPQMPVQTGPRFVSVDVMMPIAESQPAAHKTVSYRGSSGGHGYQGQQRRNRRRQQATLQNDPHSYTLGVPRIPMPVSMSIVGGPGPIMGSVTFRSREMEQDPQQQGHDGQWRQQQSQQRGSQPQQQQSQLYSQGQQDQQYPAPHPVNDQFQRSLQEETRLREQLRQERQVQAQQYQERLQQLLQERQQQRQPDPNPPIGLGSATLGGDPKIPPSRPVSVVSTVGINEADTFRPAVLNREVEEAKWARCAERLERFRIPDRKPKEGWEYN